MQSSLKLPGTDSPCKEPPSPDASACDMWKENLEPATSGKFMLQAGRSPLSAASGLVQGSAQ